MTLLSLNYFYLSLVGSWKPLNWKGWKSIFYHFYTFLVLFDLSSFLVSGLTDIFKSKIELNDSLFDVMSLLLSFIVDIMKIHCVVNYRSIITDIEKRLEDKFLKLNNHEERAIYQRYNRYARKLTTYYSTLFLLILIWYIFVRTTRMDPPHILPSRGWLPYNYSNSIVYTITAVYQLYAIINAATTNLAYDPLLPCILYYVCAHIRILKLRFKLMLEKLEQFDINVNNNNNNNNIERIKVEKEMISDWVDYHIEILSLVDTINSVFSKTIFVQYFVSAFVLCAIACLMARTSITSIAFIASFSYLLVMYIQIFVQCISAEQMTSEFADIAIDVGTANWFILSNSSQKYMVIILANSMRPVVFRSGFFLTLSLESFTKVLKLSYTVYNLIE